MKNWSWSWRYLPSIEGSRIRGTEFFPPRPSLEELEFFHSICIGTKNRTLGDALLLSTLPRKLKERFPSLKVNAFCRGFNPVVFQNNPWVDGISWAPAALYGDDCGWGSGQLIQVKEQFFYFEKNLSLKPEIYLSQREVSWAKQLLGEKVKQGQGQSQSQSGQTLIIHSSGHTRKGVAKSELWNRLVSTWKGKIDFWQVGVQGDEQISGCKGYFFSKKNYWVARKLFALISQADAFIGVDSGPMHIARAFEVPSLILVNHVDLSQVFEARKKNPYFLNRKFDLGFLYEDNQHLSTQMTTVLEDQLEVMNTFVSKILAEKVQKK